MEKIIKKLKNKQSLDFEESKSAFESMMSGKISEEQIHDFLCYILPSYTLLTIAHILHLLLQLDLLLGKLIYLLYL